MSGKELLEDRRTRYLFSQDGYNYYSCGRRFFKVDESNKGSQVIPVDLKGGVSIG